MGQYLEQVFAEAELLEAGEVTQLLGHPATVMATMSGWGWRGPYRGASAFLPLDQVAGEVQHAQLGMPRDGRWNMGHALLPGRDGFQVAHSLGKLTPGSSPRLLWHGQFMTPPFRVFLARL